ncbi:hypothetical protein [Geotalea sp. SG265]|uniref:hypothetical protein n=1 Tax=Geotalea sp. SG265 TaxID=2922867 RepID=UPI001FAFA2CB|nr:hypothetical protein [Geotalea sp. SG265]
MIYITNDSMGQAVYLELHKKEPRRRAGGVEHVFDGLVGNGVTEVPVKVRSWQDYLEIAFGGSRLFQTVEEKTLRRIMGDVVRELVVA